ncbi:hypothetical protein L2E82_42934 [Cichorium intybus]|uniref:Uncharacterized protein n=1 Tax=Cichorium intybus TaxID=13427 RepID=A0ACB8ZNU0_CICIN|nr:hypothetical protein L2E82_42934 [Cichorium intybus]
MHYNLVLTVTNFVQSWHGNSTSTRLKKKELSQLESIQKRSRDEQQCKGDSPYYCSLNPSPSSPIFKKTSVYSLTTIRRTRQRFVPEFPSFREYPHLKFQNLLIFSTFRGHEIRNPSFE